MKLRRFKTGRVLVKEIASKKFQACWLVGGTKYIRRILPTNNFREAKRLAEEINVRIAMGREAGGNGPPRHTIREAVLEAIRASDSTRATKADYISRFNQFAKFLEGRRPRISRWSEINVKVLSEFLAHCRKQNNADDTIRLRFSALRLTSTFMARNYPDHFRHVTRDFRIRRTRPSGSDHLGDRILSPEQLRQFLGWLKENEPQVHVWACMQGLVGLRLTEGLFLREQDFNREAKTITITNTEAHRPKTSASYRTIPICDAAAETLSDWIDGLKVRNSNGILFPPQRSSSCARNAIDPGARAGSLSAHRMSIIFSKAISRARSKGVDLPPAFIARRLRASFVTGVRSAGADFADLQAYIGQTPRDVLSAHYDHVGIDRFQVIANLAQGLHEGSISTEREDSADGG